MIQKSLTKRDLYFPISFKASHLNLTLFSADIPVPAHIRDGHHLTGLECDILGAEALMGPQIDKRHSIKYYWKLFYSRQICNITLAHCFNSCKNRHVRLK